MFLKVRPEICEENFKFFFAQCIKFYASGKYIIKIIMWQNKTLFLSKITK